MRINNNLMAMNSHRQLGISVTDGSKSMEKLSSGLRINRAGDDAAGLAISEKMRGQIRGLNMASKNSADTISLIQTAEGALNETHSILQRMRELTVQAANDTNTAEDRTEIQSEISQLIKEIDRIGNTTEFNTKKLLDGSARGVSDAVAATAKYNSNSATAVNIDLLNEFQASVNGDTNFFMDGSHMLVRVNGSPSAAADIENDFKLIGPDGAEYSFVKGTEQKQNSFALQENTILTVKQVIADADVNTVVDIIKEAVHDAIKGVLSLNATGTTAIASGGGSDTGATNNNDAADALISDARGAAKEALEDLKAVFGNTELIDGIIDKLLDDSTGITWTSLIGSTSANSNTPGTITLNTGFLDVTSLGMDALEDEDILAALNAINANITMSGDSDIKDDSTLAKGSILAVGSTFTVDGDNPIKIAVDNGEVTIRADHNNVIWVGNTSMADDASITLKDGTVLKHNQNGEFEITQGFVVLADKVDVAAGGSGINSLAANSVLAAGSVLAADSELGVGSIIASTDNSKLVRGTVTIDSAASNISFADHTLNADFSKMDVGLSNTFVFSTFRAGSNDLENSVMSQVGANSGQIMFVSMNDMRAAALGVDKVDVTTRYGAAMGVETVNNALQRVSQQRSILGAAQNRLEHTIKNLDTASENLQAAESRIRDVDMAKEIMEQTKSTILQQASQAMLAQANQAPQSVLQLLR